jgi:hypothetical protein
MDLFGAESDIFYSTSTLESFIKFNLTTQDSGRGRETDERNITKTGYYGRLNSFPIPQNNGIRPAQTVEELLRDIPSKYYRMDFFLNVFNGEFRGGGPSGAVHWNLKANQEIIFTFFNPGEQWSLPGARYIPFSRDNIPITPSFNDIFGYGVNFNVYCFTCFSSISPIEFKSSLTMKLTLYFKEYCSDYLDTTVCLNYCFNSNNIDACIPGNIKYCINNVQPLNSKILDICSNCYPIISAYYNTNPNKPQLLYDDAFNKLCSNLQVNPANYKTYTSDTNATINNRIAALCACHLNTSVYDNYYQELTEEVEILQSLNIGTKQCLFPECSTSVFRSSATLGNNACSSVCLNVTDLRVNGTFSNVTISSKNECQDIVRPVQRCIDDTSCSQGRLCKNNICVKGCNNDAGCSEYQSCIGGICEQMETCEVDADCPGNKKCSSGKECILRDRCKEDVDCGVGNVCIDNFCAKKEGIERWQIGVIVAAVIVFILVIIYIGYIIFKK